MKSQEVDAPVPEFLVGNSALVIQVVDMTVHADVGETVVHATVSPNTG